MGCLLAKYFEDDFDMSPIRHLPVIFVNGVPGAGNQTVAQTIANITNYIMIKPGDLIREEALKDTPRGKFIAEKLEAQHDVPEQVTVNLVKEAMLMNQDAKGFILVGFPRNPRMSHIFNRQVKWPEKIVALKVDNEVAAVRLQQKLSELGRPDKEINAAPEIVKEAAQKIKIVRKRFGRRVIPVDSNGNPTALDSTLREILSDTIEKSKTKSRDVEMEPLKSSSVPTCPVAPDQHQITTETPPPANEEAVTEIIEEEK